jgi:hypothetical protein
MATPNYPDVGTLEQAAQYRTGVPTRLLNVLTGGLAGAISGSTERAQEAVSARRALLEEDLMLKRMKAQRQLMLEEDLKRSAADREANLLTGASKAKGAAMALSGTAKDFVGPLDAATRAGMAEAELAQTQTENARMQALKSRAPEMSGYLAQRGLKLGQPDVETLAFMEAQEKTKEAAQKEERLTKAGYMSFYIPGLGQISGTPDNIEETKKKYPQYKTIIENAVKQAESGEALFTPTVEEDPVTGYRRRKLVFKPGTPISVMKAAEEEYFGKQKGAFDGEPAAGTPATKATKPNNIQGFTVRRVQ